MNKMMTMTGWLVMAAALTMSFTACSNDDNLAVAPVQPTTTSTSKVHVTVGAGISDGTTRSAVEQNGTARTLKFTEGDQLFVRYGGEIGNYGYDVYGTLTTTSSNIGANGLTAQFSGDLAIKKWRFGEGEGEIPDPDLSQLTACHFATLIPANHGSSIVREDYPDNYYNYNYHDGFTATETLNEVIARHSYVTGEIDASQNVTLTAQSCILNCTVTGLEANKSYDVRMDK